MSAAKSMSVSRNRLGISHGISKSSRSIAFCITQSITIRKRKGDRIHPCLTPVSMAKKYVVPPSFLAQQMESSLDESQSVLLRASRPQLPLVAIPDTILPGTESSVIPR
ncbi:hypothetical protein CHS0354_030511 [Potamilus streckersoni]|uniref:Uncharacterized protein n=1 Tax=Potamilus streckersoni TaxID=2493646 RepID=A0AAE0RPN7_9BIVA|nr:hypothetical protein CHS0354_030511 [Potamilus streckersoni]